MTKENEKKTQECKHQWAPLMAKAGKKTLPSLVNVCLRCGELKVGQRTIRMSRYRLDMGGLPIQNTSTRWGKSNLEWTLNKLLLGAGSGADPTEIDVPSATKEFFVVATKGSAQSEIGYHPSYYISSVNTYVWIEFHVPPDFSSLTSAALVIVPVDTVANWNVDMYSDYGAVGENYNAHSESDLNTQGATVANQIMEKSITSILSSLAAGDHVGVYVWCMANNNKAHVLGVRVKYA